MSDLTLPVENGYVNIRVGAIIMKNGKVLMASSPVYPYYYSVGGRIKFGEKSEEAVEREVLEETGYALKVDRLGFIQEDFYVADGNKYRGHEIYEITFFYYMKVPDDFEPDTTVSTDSEYLSWINPNSGEPMIPEFYAEELCRPSNNVKHFVNFKK